MDVEGKQANIAQEAAKQQGKQAIIKQEAKKETAKQAKKEATKQRSDGKRKRDGVSPVLSCSRFPGQQKLAGSHARHTAFVALPAGATLPPCAEVQQMRRVSQSFRQEGLPRAAGHGCPVAASVGQGGLH